LRRAGVPLVRVGFDHYAAVEFGGVVGLILVIVIWVDLCALALDILESKPTELKHPRHHFSVEMVTHGVTHVGGNEEAVRQQLVISRSRVIR
jgi:hypothetical protein